MKLSLEAVPHYNQIHSYDDNSVVIRPQNTSGLESFSSNFILTPTKIISDLAVDKIEDLASNHIAELKRLEPEVILIVSDSGPSLELHKLSATFAQNGIGLEFLSLGAACRTYNLLLSEERKVLLVVIF